jgi:hypothetical protein
MYTLGRHDEPSVAIDVEGKFVVVWTSSDGSGAGVFGQRFASDSQRAGSEFQVDTFTTRNEESPSVAMTPTGDFVVVWQARVEFDADVFAQRWTSTGFRIGSPFQVNTVTRLAQEAPQVAVEKSGGDQFVVTWESLNQDGSYDGVFGRLFPVGPTPTPIP